MAEYYCRKFCQRFYIKAPVTNIYKAWTTQSGLESWFLRVAEFTLSDLRLRRKDEAIQGGDAYRWLWHGYDDDTEERGKILDANGVDRLQFTFAQTCMVTITITKEQGENIVTLMAGKYTH